jgi:hypothetical protein
MATDLAEQHIPTAPPRSQSMRGTLQSPTTCFQPQVPGPNITRTEFPEVLHDHGLQQSKSIHNTTTSGQLGLRHAAEPPAFTMLQRIWSCWRNALSAPEDFSSCPLLHTAYAAPAAPPFGLYSSFSYPAPVVRRSGCCYRTIRVWATFGSRIDAVLLFYVSLVLYLPWDGAEHSRNRGSLTMCMLT